ncbi:homeodomain-interacting protein kinase 3-like [Gouania willdenowi]|uniref:homeodomain-interacting protein kinase 3-like n=1 Tax=Gouania willdenowi TaxID=441366 RepID=UPI00105416DB|nr:homeodomain-interacting protein kinase 3-like [Gouania willdenowi]
MAAVESQLILGQVLQSSSTQYTIIEFIGEGAFGKVAKCQVNSTSELVAVKILKDTFVQDVEEELSMLSKINLLDPDQFNLVKFHERFEYSSYTCLVFELLEMNLLQFLKTKLGSSMYVNQIRPIAKQMLVAIQRLQSLGITHNDIKPDNVMLVNTEEDTLQVKLIDFGQAHPSSSTTQGKWLQPMGYRAPEVCLGLPFTEAIDMWGLGYMLANLYLNTNLFPVSCEYLMMKAMVEYLGMPSEDQLLFGMHTKRFFCQEADEFGLGWRLLTPEEYSDINRVKAKEWPTWRPHFFSLDDLLYIYEEEDAEEFKDRTEFIDFLKHLLTLDEEKRFSPTEALQHPFIRMSHLSQDPDSSDYLTTAQALMPTEASHSVTPVKDGEAHVAEEADEVPPTPASSQITHIETDVPKVPLSHVNDDNERVQESCQDLGKELHLPATQSDSGICSFPEQFPNHCDEGLECVSSVNGPMVEDVPFPTPKRFKNIRRFFSRIQKLFFSCCCSSMQE